MELKPYRHEVKYYECDRMGITHHSNYIRFMEEARVDWMDQLGFGFERMEAEGVVSPVVSVECRYRQPSTFKDVIEISVAIAETTPLKVVCVYRHEHTLLPGRRTTRVAGEAFPRILCTGEGINMISANLKNNV